MWGYRHALLPRNVKNQILSSSCTKKTKPKKLTQANDPLVSHEIFVSQLMVARAI